MVTGNEISIFCNVYLSVPQLIQTNHFCFVHASLWHYLLALSMQPVLISLISPPTAHVTSALYFENDSSNKHRSNMLSQYISLPMLFTLPFLETCLGTYKLGHKKTCFLHLQKQRHRSAAQMPVTNAFVFCCTDSTILLHLCKS